MFHSLRKLLFGLACFSPATTFSQVVVNEIHYNPVERPAFNATGNPVFQGTNTPADFTDDVHEFVELYNPTAAPVDLSGWRLEGGVDFTFAAGASIPAGGYSVVAKNPSRIQAVYGVTGVLGPYIGKLGNNGDNVRLLTPSNLTSDAVSYEPSSPWAISADRLGAGDDFTLLNSATYQYKGRSLQRVSASAASNDPGNWVAVRPASGPTTFADLPTPGAANIVVRGVPKPVVTAHSATQLTDGATIIRSSAQVRILASFTPSSGPLANVEVEYFVDNINAWGEARTSVAATALGNNQFGATLPARPDRSVVRYRIKADRGDGSEVVSPRADDPAIVPTGISAREAWHSYFVTPVRSSPKPVYDCFVSTDGQVLSDTQGTNIFPFNGLNGLQTIAYNATGNLRRVVSSATITDTYPRELGWPGVTAADRIWNGTVPGVFIENGRVRDVHVRFHGSRYNRRPSRKSYKLLFPDHQLYLRADSMFITDKGDAFMTAHGLHQLAGLPLSHVRHVDWYFNNDGGQTRLEQGEYNGDLLDLYHEKMQRLNPGSAQEETGELYKSVGVILGSGNATFPGGSPSGGEGPYGSGNAWPLPATFGSASWTELQRFDYTYGLQNHAWKGPKPIRDMVMGMWAARGDTYASPNPNIANVRTWLQQNWDVDAELTSLALGNWMCPWDDTTQNHFFWRRANGRWVRLLWDFDAMYGGGSPATSSIYHGEVGDPANNFRGPHYTKDSMIKAFRPEYRERLWFLNNTLLDPDNLGALTYVNSGGSLTTYLASIGGFATQRFDYVNLQVNLGVFYKPTRPTNTTPTNAAAVLPGANLAASAYVYRATRTLALPPAVSPHTTSKWEIRPASGSYDDPAFVLTSATNLTSLPIPFAQLTYGQTYFWRVTYFDALGHPSITSAETSFSYGPASTSAGNVTINEIMAENLTAVTNGPDRPDYVELKNTTGTSIDISGWKLTDDELVPGKYIFPSGTSIPGGGHLIVWCDNNTTSPGLHSGFGLSRLGQRVLLITNTNLVRDAISFGPQAPNTAIGRVTDGNGSWTLVGASPGAANSARAFSTNSSTLKINEWMATPASGDDWFEIHNAGPDPVALAGLWLSDTPGTPKVTQIPALSFVAANGCVRFDADGTTRGFNSVNFKLSSAGDNLLLSSSNGITTIDAVTFGSQAPGVSEGRFPDGSASLVLFPQSPSPNDNNWLPAAVRINEALSSSVPPLEDYVEIHNPSNAEVDLSKWWLSDDPSAKQKYQFPDGSLIPAAGYLIVPESAFNVGANAFALSSLGDELVLSAADAAGALTGYRSQFNFGAAADDVAFGHVATGSKPEFWPQVNRTPEALNSAPRIGPVIINEIHYHPSDVGGLDNARDEFIEVHNISPTSVDLSGWRLKGGSDFTFPAGTTLSRGGYILVVTFAPATDIASLDAFRSALNVPPSVPIYGPFTPKLGNDSLNVEIATPFTGAGGIARFVNVDKVEYADFAPWPIAPDGTGASLQRISRAVIGNDVSNWSSAAPTPGTVNTGQEPLIEPVSFSSHPTGQTVNPGTGVTFQVEASGSAPLTYQWRKDGVALDGKTEPSLALIANEGDEGSYDVVVSNAAGPLTSNPAVLMVNDPIVITTPPGSQTVNPNAPVSFLVAVTGTGPFTYQWRKNEQPIEGANAAELAFSASESAEGTYDVIVTNMVGPVQSAAASLSVNDPVGIATPPGEQTVDPGESVTFSVGVFGTGPFQYQWRKNGSDIEGATSADFTIATAAEGDEGNYTVRVSNGFSEAVSAPASLSVNNPVQITGQPKRVVVRVGANAMFTVSATGTGPLSFQWRRNQTPIAGATSASCQIAGATSGDLGSYDVVVGNSAGEVTSSAASLSFLDPEAAAGTYQGILAGADLTDPAKHPYAGRITIKLAKTLKLTGKVEYFGLTHAIKAQLDLNLEGAVTIRRSDGSTVAVTLRLDGASELFNVTCAHSVLNAAYEATADAAHIPKRARTAFAPLAGRYTVVLRPGLAQPDLLRAPGFLTMKIANSGNASWVGKLPDTTPFRGSGWLSPENEVAFYARLYAANPLRAGHIAGPFSIGGIGVAGDLSWRKPPQTKGEFWRNGLTALMDAEGSPWVPPVRTAPVLASGPMTFRIESASSTAFEDFAASFTAQSKFVFPGVDSEKLRLTINRANGQLSGKFFDESSGQFRPLQGVFLQNQLRGDGFSAKTGAVRVWELVLPE